MTINDIHPPSYRNTGFKDKWDSTLIMKGAVIGNNATLFPVVIGKYSKVGAGSVVIRDVKDNEVVAGNPARKIK